MDFTEKTNLAHTSAGRAVLATSATVWPQTVLHQERPKKADQDNARKNQSLQKKKMETTYIPKKTGKIQEKKV